MSDHQRQGEAPQAQHSVPQINSMAQLRGLLSIGSTRQLGYFLLASDHLLPGDNSRKTPPYKRFTITKHDGTQRIICAPLWPLRRVQRQILDKILSKVVPHPAAHGFVCNRSTVTNAAPHHGAALLLKFDLNNFFPTIHYIRVVGLFASLGYVAGEVRFHSDDESTQVAPALARLCCFTPDPRRWEEATLPQGAPTSPVIANLVCRRLDARLNGLGQQSDGVYTRYADDLTISFREKTPDVRRFRWWVERICHEEGFFLNQKKFHVIRRSQRQLVTGIVVNQVLRVPREERRRFRATLHNCRKYGVASQARGRVRFAHYLRGFASYVHMIHPEEGAELLREVEALLGPEMSEPPQVPPASLPEGEKSREETGNVNLPESELIKIIWDILWRNDGLFKGEDLDTVRPFCHTSQISDQRLRQLVVHYQKEWRKANSPSR